MARIPKLMIYNRGERISMVYVFSLPIPELEVVFSDDGNSCSVDIKNRNPSYAYVYALDGNEPERNGATFDGPLTFDEAFVIKVKAYKVDGESPVATCTIGQVGKPEIDVDGGRSKVADVIISTRLKV